MNLVTIEKLTKEFGDRPLLEEVDLLINAGDRIGLIGHSWGGYETAYITTQTRRFAAAVAGAPVVNMISAYNGIRWSTGKPRQFQYERTQSRIGGSLAAPSAAFASSEAWGQSLSSAFFWASFMAKAMQVGTPQSPQLVLGSSLKISNPESAMVNPSSLTRTFPQSSF